MNREIVLPGGAGLYPLIGDIQSTAGSNTVLVTGIQSVPVVDNPYMVGGEVLEYNGGSWVPTIPTPPTNINLETNGTPNGSQTKLNLVAGTNITLVDDGTGDVSITAASGGSYTLGGTLTTANVSIGPALGTGATIDAVSGLDGNHFIEFTVGSSPLSVGILLSVSFTASRGHVTYPILGLGSSFDYGVNNPFTSSPSATGYTLSANGPLSTGASYQLSVSCP